MVGALPKRGNFAAPGKEGSSSLADPEGEFETSPGTEPAQTQPAEGAKAAEAVDPDTGEIIASGAKTASENNPPASSEEGPAESALDPEGEYILETTFSGEAA